MQLWEKALINLIIDSKKDLWFQTELTRDDIETMMTQITRLYQSGNYILVRSFIDTNKATKCIAYDENEIGFDLDTLAELDGNTKESGFIEIREYIADKKMFLCVQDWCKAYMMRPCVFRLDWLDSRDTQKMLYANRRWPSMTKESKILDCERYDISLSDYVDTPSITCKI